MRYAIHKLLCGAALALAPQAAAAQAQAPEPMAEPAAEPAVVAPALSLELNVLEPRDDACRFVFVAENRLGGDLASAVFETVIFDRDGRVERLTLFDFNDLPEGRVRVRSFDLGGVDCAGVGQVLINAAHACSGAGLGADACMAGLAPSSRVDGVEVSG